MICEHRDFTCRVTLSFFKVFIVYFIVIYVDHYKFCNKCHTNFTRLIQYDINGLSIDCSGLLFTNSCSHYLLIKIASIALGTICLFLCYCVSYM